MDKKGRRFFFNSESSSNKKTTTSKSRHTHKSKFKIPWKKHSGLDYESSEQLDAFIKEVIEKAKQEYLRECEAMTSNKYVQNQENETPGTEIKEGEIKISTEQEICNASEDVKLRVTPDDGKQPQSQEKKPLLNQTSSEPETEIIHNESKIRAQILFIFGCRWCRCCSRKYEVT